ncbi:hypothetical protein WJX82_005813 [Trebouxia sp. C0006]
MDEQILPALYAFVAHSFQASPSQLGALTLSRALMQAILSPFSGLCGYYCNRVRVTSIGCFVWGACTAGFSTCRSLRQGYVFWAINGVALSLVIPTGQSLIADSYRAQDRGKAFGGVLLFSGSVAGMIGSLYATNLGGLSFFGWEGWRVVLLSLALVSFGIGALNWWQAHDPNYTLDGRAKLSQDAVPTLKEVWRESKDVMCVHTFLLIIMQGVVGSIPWTALVFLTLYLQLIGMSDLHAGMLMSMSLGAYGVGNLIGGWVGDAAASRFPDHGRIAVAQFAEFIRIPISWLIIKGLPENGKPGSFALYACALVAMNSLGSWAGPACNNSAFADIVPPHMRNLVFAFDRCFEGAVAACAAPLVGMLAEKRFGFKGTAAQSGDPTIDVAKARALGNALVPFLVVPWTCSLIVYSGLHFTYPKDRKAASQAATPPGAHHLQLSSSDSHSDDEQAFRNSDTDHRVSVRDSVSSNRPLKETYPSEDINLESQQKLELQHLRAGCIDSVTSTE